MKRQDRIPMGTYPKFIGKFIRWALNGRLPSGVTILLRGRGKAKNGVRGRFDLAVKNASHTALYLIHTYKTRETQI
jgi:hypothetical protein